MTIFYFSGTGNSFHVAKQLAAGGGPNTDILPIVQFSDGRASFPNVETAVIVCPVYFYGIPPVVADFVARLDVPRLRYFSVVFTADFPNGRAITELQELCRKSGLRLNSSFYLKMPTNYVIKSRLLSPVEIERTLDKAEKKHKRITAIINARQDFLEKDSFLYSWLVGITSSQKHWEEIYPQFDAQFWSQESCNSCGLCQVHCPVGNIRVEGRPRWGGKCVACLKCINICPQGALQYGESTEGKPRYFHPQVKLGELKQFVRERTKE